MTDPEVSNRKAAVIVVGAGVAGLSAARALQAPGADVLVVEKSRGVGGRSATRTLRGHRVDHGAQYFTVRDESFRSQVEAWLETGDVAVWSHGFHIVDADGLHPPEPSYPRYVFPAGMNVFGKLLAAGLEVKRETRVTALAPVTDGWRLEASTTGGTHMFEAQNVVLNLPPEQALELCGAHLEPEVRAALLSVVMQPCFSLMVGFAADPKPEWRGVKLDRDSPLAWVAHDSSKRTLQDDTVQQDTGQRDTMQQGTVQRDTVLVAHSTPEYARENYTLPLDEVAAQLLTALAKVDDRFSAPHWTDLQRWRYAMATQFLDEPYLRQGSLLFCGDWCGGNKLESAYLSGLAAARAVSG